MKQCSTCRELKDESEFGKHKGNKDGLHHQCKLCHKQYYQRNRTARLEYRAQYYSEHREDIAEYKKQYQAQNRARLKQEKEQYYQDNREWFRENNRQYYRENRDRRLKHVLEYAQTPQGKASCARARAKRRSAEQSVLNDLSLDDLNLLMALQNGFCVNCGVDISDGNYHRDHIVPVSRGGGLTMKNVQLLCPSCNCKKKDATADCLDYYLYTGKFPNYWNVEATCE